MNDITRERIDKATAKQIDMALEYMSRLGRLLDSEYKALGKIKSGWQWNYDKMYWSTIGYIDGKSDDETLLWADCSRVSEYISSMARILLEHYNVEF